MIEIKIKKCDKYYSISPREFYDPLRRDGYWLSTEKGEGTELNEADFYDHIKKYFDEKM